LQIIFVFVGIVFSLLSLSLLVEVWGTDLESVIDDFTRDLETEISDSISSSLNNTDNMASTQVITSNLFNGNVDNNFSSQTVTKSSNNGGGNGGISIGLTGSVNINSNGICTNTLIGGDSSDVMSSTGNCDDQLTGGNAADKFICGAGKDVIKDYNAKEGDIILDKQNCETILKS
jgi:hypothetical protein